MGKGSGINLFTCSKVWATAVKAGASGTRTAMPGTSARTRCSAPHMRRCSAPDLDAREPNSLWLTCRQQPLHAQRVAGTRYHSWGRHIWPPVSATSSERMYTLCRVRAWARAGVGQPARAEEPGRMWKGHPKGQTVCLSWHLAGAGKMQRRFAAFAATQARPRLQLPLTRLSEADAGHVPKRVDTPTPRAKVG